MADLLTDLICRYDLQDTAAVAWVVPEVHEAIHGVYRDWNGTKTVGTYGDFPQGWGLYDLNTTDPAKQYRTLDTNTGVLNIIHERPTGSTTYLGIIKNVGTARFFEDTIEYRVNSAAGNVALSWFDATWHILANSGALIAHVGQGWKSITHPIYYRNNALAILVVQANDAAAAINIDLRSPRIQQLTSPILNGTAATLTTTGIGGIFPNALLLNGSNQYIDIGYQHISGDRTISCFFKPTSVGANQCLLDIGDSKFYMLADGQFSYYPNSVAANSGYYLSAGYWYHLAVSQSGTTAYYYVDGVLVHTATVETPGTGSVPSAIGRQDTAGPYANGAICGVRVYAAAKTADDIKALNAERRLFLPALAAAINQ